jgi:hypothetical protein
MKNPFRYFDSSPEGIRLVVMMYVRYPLRNVMGDSVGAERVARQHFHEEIEEQPQGWQHDPDLGAVINGSVLHDA